jgi:hypothetical protein
MRFSLSKRILATRTPFLERKIELVRQSIKEYEGGIDASFNVYKTARAKEDIGGMIGDLSRVAMYKTLKHVAEQELSLLEKVDSDEDWLRIKPQIARSMEWRQSGEARKVESKAIQTLSSEYWSRCPKGDQLPHEVLNVKVR